MDEELKVEFSSYGKYRIIRFPEHTRLVLYNCTDLKDIFKTGNSEKVIDWILDLSNVEFMDSAALATIVNQTRHLGNFSKKLIILSPHKKLKHLVELVSFNSFFEMLFKIF